MADFAELRFIVSGEIADPVANVLTEGSGQGIELRDGETLSAPDPGKVEIVLWVTPEQVDPHVEKIERLIASLKAPGDERGRMDLDQRESAR